MFKYLFAAIVAISLFSAPVYAKCIGDSQADFEAYVDKNNYKTFELKGVALDKLRNYINTARAKNKLWALEFDTFVFSKIREGTVGTVMFKDGCVVPGSVNVTTFDDFVNFMTDAGIAADEYKVLIRV